MNDWELNIFSTAMGDYEALLYDMLLGKSEKFVDWERQKAAFDSQEFMDILSFCKEYKEQDWPDTSDWISEEYDRNTLFNKVVLGGGFETYLSYVSSYGRDYRIYGFPTDSGQMYGIGACYDSCAIYAGSRQKEGAWEFVESLLMDTNQYYLGIANPGFPIRKSVLEEMKQETMALKLNREEVTMSDSEKDIIEEIIYSGEVGRTTINSNIWNVLREETPYYFEGERSLEDTAAIIQSRVQIILQE